jgi:hypothetical protein
MRRHPRLDRNTGAAWFALTIAVVALLLWGVGIVLRTPGAWPEPRFLRVSNLSDDSLLVDTRWHDDVFGVTGHPARSVPRGGDVVLRHWRDTGVCLRLLDPVALRPLTVFLTARYVAPGDTAHVEVHQERSGIRASLSESCPLELARDPVRYDASSDRDLDAPVRIRPLRELRNR